MRSDTALLSEWKLEGITYLTEGLQSNQNVCFCWEWPGTHMNFTTLQGNKRIFPPTTLCTPPLPYPLAANIHCSLARLRGSVPRVVRVILSHYLAFYVNWKDIVAKKKIIVRINIKNNSSWQQKACSHQHFRVLNEFIISTKNGEVDLFVQHQLVNYPPLYLLEP